MSPPPPPSSPSRSLSAVLAEPVPAKRTPPPLHRFHIRPPTSQSGRPPPSRPSRGWGEVRNLRASSPPQLPRRRCSTESSIGELRFPKGLVSFPLCRHQSHMEKFRVYRNSSLEWKPSAVLALATSADGSQVAVAREDGTMEIWLVSPGSVGWHCQLVLVASSRFLANWGLLLSIYVCFC